MKKEEYREKLKKEAAERHAKFLDIIRKSPEEALGLIDGAYTLVELYKPEGPYNVEWRKKWLAKAREFGAVPEW